MQASLAITRQSGLMMSCSSNWHLHFVVCLCSLPDMQISCQFVAVSSEDPCLEQPHSSVTTISTAGKRHSTRQNRRFLLLSYMLVFCCRRSLEAGKACHVMLRILACIAVLPLMSIQKHTCEMQQMCSSSTAVTGVQIPCTPN